MFNLQQRNNNVSSLFQPMNNPSLSSSVQNFVQKQEHNSDSSSKTSEKEDSPSKNKLFNDILKGEGRNKKKESHVICNNNGNDLMSNNMNHTLQMSNNHLAAMSQQQQMNGYNGNNNNSNSNAMNVINNLNFVAMQQQNSLQQNFPSFDVSSLQTEEQTKQLLLTKMIVQQQQMINSLLLNNNTIPSSNIQLQQQQQQQLQTLLQQQQLFQTLQQTQSPHMMNQNNFIAAPQSTPSIPTSSTMTSHNTVAPQLSNRYSMSGNEKVQTTENDDSEDENSKFKNQLKKSIRKRQKKINNCGHPDREHYAKGMCSNCYHKYGRTKKPWLCPHEKLYACGLCQNCYINKYNQKKRTENDGPMDGSEKIESDDQQQNFSEIDQPEKINLLAGCLEVNEKILKKQMDAQLAEANQISQSQIKSSQNQQDQAAYGDDEDLGDDDDEEDDAQ